jgi:hypothetical protein
VVEPYIRKLSFQRSHCKAQEILILEKHNRAWRMSFSTRYMSDAALQAL